MAEVANGFKSAGALLGLHALTSLHPGTGTALGTVDLPVQRERHTQWPTISGSALKGVLRDACRESIKSRYQDDGEDLPERERRTRRDKANEDRDLVSVFGPPTGRADEHAGALSLTDARILAFPVRSLKGLFAWVTCPEILNRLKRDMSLIGLHASWQDMPPLGENQAHTLGDSPCLDRSGKQLVLEEYDFERAGEANAEVARWVAQGLFPSDETYTATKKRFPSHCVMLRDEDFTHFARYATEVTARIGLDYEKKTVRDGALFYQEFLPAETMFYSVVLAHPARLRTGGKSAAEVLEYLRRLPPYLQIGGDETTGKGYCAVRLYSTTGREA